MVVRVRDVVGLDCMEQEHDAGNVQRAGGSSAQCELRLQQPGLCGRRTVPDAAIRRTLSAQPNVLTADSARRIATSLCNSSLNGSIIVFPFRAVSCA